MDSKEKMISDISVVIAGLSRKLETLQAQVEELCRSTGACGHVKKVNKELLTKKEGKLGTNIDPLREKK
jgi:hypothetical protein|tara:strand:+ start:254 stop:460 length:207 start_codon:yes stop_codon:yes gene_type:complete